MIDNKILGIGIDSIDIKRFENWKNLSKKNLLKVFSHEEIEYCLDCSIKSPERFAARFAAKEATYKALSPNISFIKFCKYVEIKKDKNIPKLLIKNNILEINNGIESFISITHTKTVATAIVIIYKKN